MNNRILLLATAYLAALLAGCSAPTDTQLADMSQPKKAAEAIKALSPEDQRAYAEYVAEHRMTGDLDGKMTVQEAVKARKAETAREATAKKNAASIQ